MGKSRAAARRSKGTPRRYRPGASGNDRWWHTAWRTVSSAKELLEFENPFHAECWLSSLVSVWEELHLVDEDAEKVVGGAIVDAAAAKGDVSAYTLLRGLAILGGDGIRSRAGAAAHPLDDLRAEAPPWLTQLGGATLREVWRTQEPFGDGDFVTLVRQHPGYEPHAIAVYLDHNLGSAAKDVLVADDASMLRDIWERDVSDVSVVDIDAQEAADALVHGLKTERIFRESPATKEFLEMRPLLRIYLRALPLSQPIDHPTMSEAERDRLATEFAISPEAHELDSAVIDDLAWRMIHFSCDYSDGDPLRWSPVVVEMFMADWLPRKAMLDVSEDDVPDAVRAWVRFAGRRRGLRDDLIDEAVAAVARWTPEFISAINDRTRFGPSKAILGAMLDEGIDITDQAARDAWVRDFNASPEEERRKVLR